MPRESSVILRPKLPLGSQAADRFTLFAVEAANIEPRLIDAVRDEWLARVSPSASDGQTLRVCISVLADLKAQGWSLQLHPEGVSIAQPTAHSLPAKIDETLRSPVITVQGGEVSER